jgi:hypothetical protein
VGHCTAACTLTHGGPASTNRGLGSGVRVVRSSRGHLGEHWSGRKPYTKRGFGVRAVCSGSVLVAEVSKRRRAQRNHCGCGQDGGRGPSSSHRDTMRGRKDVESLVTWQQVLRRRACGGPLAGGRCPGSRKPRIFTGCWWNGPWPSGSAVLTRCRLGVTGAPELQRSPVGVRPIATLPKRGGWAK